MLFKATSLASIIPRIVHTAAASYTFSAPVSKSSYNKPQINLNLLHQISQEQTLKVLDLTAKHIHPVFHPDREESIVFDKLTQNLDSETYRIFDLYVKQFVSVKILNLDTESGWKYLNIALRHYHNKNDVIRSFYYEKPLNKAVITCNMGTNSGTEVTMSEYVSFRNKNNILWKEDELKLLMWQLVNILNTAKNLGVTCNYLKPEHLLVNLDGNSVKLYDYSGFEIHSKPRMNMNVILTTLVNIINHDAPVMNHLEAMSYLSIHFPEFLAYFQRTASKINSELSIEYQISTELENNSLPRQTHYPGLKNFIADKMKGLLLEKNLPYFEENLGLITQGLSNYRKAAEILEQYMEDQLFYGEVIGRSLRATLNLAEVYRLMKPRGYPRSLEYFRQVVTMCTILPGNYSLRARGMNEYGKILLDEGKIKEAVECFEDAYKLLKYLKDSSRLKQEIKTNCDYGKALLVNPHLKREMDHLEDKASRSYHSRQETKVERDYDEDLWWSRRKKQASESESSSLKEEEIKVAIDNTQRRKDSENTLLVLENTEAASRWKKEGEGNQNSNNQNVADILATKRANRWLRLYTLFWIMVLASWISDQEEDRNLKRQKEASNQKAAQDNKQEQKLKQKQKYQEWINWALFGGSFLVSTAMIFI